MSVAPATDDPMIDRVVLGRYRIMRHLADGGMGTIYLARNEGSAGFVRPVVIKWVLPTHSGDSRITSLFLREARIMAKLSHPEIVTVLDFAEEDGMYIMALEYVHGYPLGRWYRFVNKFRGKFPGEMAAHIGIKVLHALDYAHNLTDEGQPLKIVHRDVTPSNILVDMQGHVKLADFGVGSIASEKTSVGDQTVKGKFAYLPPESFDRVPASPLTDVYSMAVTLHEVLIGTNEFGAGNPSMAETIGRVMKHIPTRLDKARSDISPQLAAVIAKGLAKKPQERFQTAAEFARALAGVRQGSEADTTFELKKLAEQDFRDDRLALMSSMPQLSELESAWRTPSPPRVSTVMRAQSQAERPSSQPGATTQSAESAPSPTPAPAPAPAKKRTWLWVAIVIVLVGALGFAAWVAISALNAVKDVKETPKQEKPTYIVVDQRGSAGSNGSGAAPVVDAGVAPPPPADAKATVKTPPPPPTPPPTEVDPNQLARTFGKRTAEINACFKQHADPAPDNLSIRIEIDATGKVIGAAVSPASVSATGLGKCLEELARSTAFGAQPKAAAFRVPLQTKRGG